VFDYICYTWINLWDYTGNYMDYHNYYTLSASFSIIYCIDCESIFYVFFNIYFPKFLGFVIRKLHFHVMDSKIIHAACMRAAVTVIDIGVAIIEQERNRIYIPREPRINAIAQREFYIDSILNRGDRHCIE